MKQHLLIVTLWLVLLVPSDGSAASLFMNNGNGTMTDTSTGLVWVRNVIMFGRMNWYDAVAAPKTLSSSGLYGLSDGSRAGDWRLPTLAELKTFICWPNNPVWQRNGCDGSNTYNPNGAHPYEWLNIAGFWGVSPDGYWSATDYNGDPNRAWSLETYSGSVGNGIKNGVWPDNCLSVLPVRNLLPSDPVRLTIIKTGITTDTVAVNSGVISWSGAEGTVNYHQNTSVTLTTSTADNSRVGSWSGCDRVDGPNYSQCTVVMTGFRTVSATFEPDRNISIDPPQVPPVAGTFFSFTPNIPNAEYFTISGQPGWAGFDPVTGTISGTPLLGDVGPNKIVLTAHNGLNILTASFIMTVYEPSKTTAGDLTGEGTVNVFDALLTLQFAVGLYQPINETGVKGVVDVAPLGFDGKPQGDGVVDVFDALAILRHAVGLDPW